MTHERLTPEERLVLAAAALPPLSAGLRTRVLTAAVARRERRLLGKYMVSAAGLMIAGLGLAAWLGPRSVANDESVERGGVANASAPPPPALNGPVLNVSARYGNGELLLSAGSDDWRLVEAEVQSRCEGSRQLGMSF